MEWFSQLGVKEEVNLKKNGQQDGRKLKGRQTQHLPGRAGKLWGGERQEEVGPETLVRVE